MQCTVLLFAQLAEAVGERALSVTLPEGSSVDDALHQLANDHAPIGALGNRLAAAVNEQYAPQSTLLHDGDTLALIPPVSGG